MLMALNGKACWNGGEQKPIGEGSSALHWVFDELLTKKIWSNFSQEIVASGN